ncbi:MAG TPA: ABC transporter permease [Phycisphaerae bacterium]|jgi:ABC-2 type transport system permease protein|nr:ABC transporter permease [Phycisphaerae bacterium]HQL54236.1 ABC transporter permease [Phycisphaerae bacterium]
MDKVFSVARREFLATVRTKAFVLSVVLMPGIIVGAIYGSEWAERVGREETRAVRRIAIDDQTGVVLPEFLQQVAAYNAERPNQPLEIEPVSGAAAETEALAARVQRGELYGYMLIRPDAIALDGQGCTVARKDNQLETGRRLEQMINEAVYAVRCRDAGLDPAQIARLRQGVPIVWSDAQTGKAVGVNPVFQFLTPFAFMFLLFMGTFGISQGLLTTLIEEKGSRVIEVLLSAVSPLQLLAGKILGTVAVGFLLMAVWGGVGFASAQKYNVGELVTTYRLLVALAYFVPGFLLISSLLAAIGSACNELKDAQSMVFPLSLITIVPMVMWYYLAEHPQSIISVVASYIPPITPFVMILRVCADPHTPAWQVVSTLGLLWLSVLVTMWAAAKVFRVGVLMYGKPPSVRELARWVRYS